MFQNHGGIIRTGTRSDAYNDSKKAIEDIRSRPLVENGILDLNRMYPSSTIIYQEIEQAINTHQIDINKSPMNIPSGKTPLEAACWLGKKDLVTLFIQKYGKDLKVTQYAKSIAKAEDYDAIYNLLCQHESGQSEEASQVTVIGDDTCE
jgi:hypothetical protein